MSSKGKNGTQPSRITTGGSLGSEYRKRRYREILEDISTNEENDNNKQIDKTKHAVKEVHNLLANGSVEERATHPGEGYLDSRVLRATSDLAVRCSEAVSGNVNTYDRHELAQHIKDHPHLYNITFPLETPPLAYLFGTFAPSPPERVPTVRRRTERQQVAAKTAPENVDKLEKTEEGAKIVERVKKFIEEQYKRTQEPQSYFHLVLDPNSFSRSVENIYLVSFLVKDGHVAIHIDEEHGLPFVTPTKFNSSYKDDTDEKQFIVSIDMKRWKELVQAFNIDKPMMVLKERL